MSDEPATVARVARHAGVSVASVSRVLNGLPASEQMAERVRAAAAELGYRPNAAARSLKVRRSGQLALAVADVGNPVYVAMMRAIEDETRAHGYRLVVSSTGGRTDDVLDLLDGLGHGYVDGLVLSPLRVDEALLARLRERDLARPTVVIGTVPDDLGLDCVRADSAAGVRLALAHLRDQGRRRVAFVNGPADTVPGSARLRAFEAGRRDLGLDPDPALLVTAGDFTLAEGRKAAETLLDRVSPDAVLGGNDLLATATAQVLAGRGLRVPEDVAVVGIDDTELADVTALSSVDLGADRRGRAAAQLLLARLEHPDRPPQRVTVPPHLTVRASSAAPSRGAS